MNPLILESGFAWWVDWPLVSIMGDTMPPRDPNDDDDDEEDDEDEDRQDEPAVIREPEGN